MLLNLTFCLDGLAGLGAITNAGLDAAAVVLGRGGHVRSSARYSVALETPSSRASAAAGLARASSWARA